MQQIIPGARERNTLTHRQPGTMGGPGFGSADIQATSGPMDAATIADRQMEGGGAPGQRPRASVIAGSAPEPLAFAACPSCHTVDATMTNAAVSGGADWQCGRCGQKWSATRLATAAAYATWLAAHTVRLAGGGA